MINIYNPNITKYSESAINAIQTGWISNHGEYIEKSTNKLKEILGSKYCILMANGTCATHCLFLSIQYKYPHINKIYVSNNSYVAAYNSALMVYQIEVMKMNNKTWNICTEEEYIMSLDTNSAILIVHNLGNIINVPRLKKIRPDIILVEDNCEGIFGKYNDLYSGTSEDSLCSSMSFYGNKIITTGEGGAFLTQHSDVYDYIKRVYSQGMSNIRYLHDVLAYNYRMTNIEAAFLYDQLNDITNILDLKRKVFENYESLLEPWTEKGIIKTFDKEEKTYSADWIFAIRIVGNMKSIEETTLFFNNLGMDIRPFFYPINKHLHLSGIKIKDPDPIPEILNKEIIMIPSSPLITLEEQQKVVDAVEEFIMYNANIKIVPITDVNIDILRDFIKPIDSDYFRYYNNRKEDCIRDHVVTFLFYDIIENTYFGYTHIDYELKTNQNWFGIYLHESYRGKKLGVLLLNYTINKCRKNIIHLSVDIDNISAIKLYEKNGFILESVKNNVCYMQKK